jgi:dolichol-phosphate mannosyltransferase
LNEEKNILVICDELLKTLKSLKEKYGYEIIFVDDGSDDKSLEILEKLTKQNNKVKYIQFSRNFGKGIALSAGLQNISGDVAISIDADLQHPPEFIPEFLDKWEKGAEIVVGIREKYDTIGIFRKFCNFFFYKLQNLISEVKIFSNETDYRLLDRKVVEEFNKFTERSRITRGLIDWLGFKKDYVYFPVKERKNAKPGYSFFKLSKLAIETILSHSLFPLKLAGYLGVIITFFSGCLGLVILIDKYLLNDRLIWNITGTAVLAVLILFLVGIILCALGVIALYIANIRNEVFNRPLYIIKKKKNFKK